MKKLLEELAKIDGAFQAWSDFANAGEMGETDLDHLQGCVQRAIETKGWIWTVTKEDSQSPYAIDGTPYSVVIFNDQIDILIEDVYADSPAKAILACYLSAMRSQP